MSRTAHSFVFAAALALSCFAGRGEAQTIERARAAVSHELRLDDGSRAYGSVVSSSAEEIVFETMSGVTIRVRPDQVVSLKQVEGVVRDGEFQPSDPNSTRLLFAPTGRSLPKGQAYLGIYEFFMPIVQVGVTDRFSIGGGTPLFFAFEGDGFDRPYWVTPKLQVYDGRKVQAAVGLFQGFGGGGSAGIAYGVVTAGGAAGSVTAGAGVGYNDAGDRTAIVMVGGDSPMRRNVKFITENYLLGNGAGVASMGVRFFGERLSADLALAMPFGSDIGTFVFPVVNFVYLF